MSRKEEDESTTPLSWAIPGHIPLSWCWWGHRLLPYNPGLGIVRVYGQGAYNNLEAPFNNFSRKVWGSVPLCCEDLQVWSGGKRMLWAQGKRLGVPGTNKLLGAWVQRLSAGTAEDCIPYHMLLAERLLQGSAQRLWYWEPRQWENVHCKYSVSVPETDCCWKNCGPVWYFYCFCC